MKTAEDLLSRVPEQIFYCSNCNDIWSSYVDPYYPTSKADDYCLNCNSTAYTETWNKEKHDINLTP